MLSKGEDPFLSSGPQPQVELEMKTHSNPSGLIINEMQRKEDLRKLLKQH